MSIPPPPGTTTNPSIRDTKTPASLPPRPSVTPPATAASSYYASAPPGVTAGPGAPGLGAYPPRPAGPPAPPAAATAFAPRSIAPQRPYAPSPSTSPPPAPGQQQQPIARYSTVRGYNHPPYGHGNKPYTPGYPAHSPPPGPATTAAPGVGASASLPYRSQYTSSPHISAPAVGPVVPASHTTSAPAVRYSRTMAGPPRPGSFGAAGGAGPVPGMGMGRGVGPGVGMGMGMGMGRGAAPGSSGLDPETEAQIAQWQSAYMAPEAQTPPAATGPSGFGPVGPVPVGPAPIGPGMPLAANLPTPAGPQLPNQQQKHAGPSYPHAAQQTAPNGKTVVREGGGQKWTDPTLLEWDPSHFRLFVGNLAGEVTDDSLFKAFSRYASVSKARVIRDKRTEKSKGYGFVSFADGDDYFKAAREMQGKYIGSHPVLLKKAVTEIKAVSRVHEVGG
ncbi:hypothetical protein KEM55_005150 [Ascosphaera atra]|nr:hypothetical protein KEM55_005150 [Ascosphaera atra]